MKKLFNSFLIGVLGVSCLGHAESGYDFSVLSLSDYDKATIAITKTCNDGVLAGDIDGHIGVIVDFKKCKAAQRGMFPQDINKVLSAAFDKYEHDTGNLDRINSIGGTWDKFLGNVEEKRRAQLQQDFKEFLTAIQDYSQQSINTKQEQDKQQEVKEKLVIADYQKKLVSKQLPIKDLFDTVLYYSNQQLGVLELLAASPLVSPDNSVYVTTQYVVLDGQVEPGLIRAYIRAASPVYVFLKMTSASKNYAPLRLNVEPYFVIGKYVDNLQYDTVDAGERTAPVIEVIASDTFSDSEASMEKSRAAILASYGIQAPPGKTGEEQGLCFSSDQCQSMYGK